VSRTLAAADPAPRLWGLGVLLLLWATAVLVRLFVLQVVDYAWLTRKAERQQSRTIEIEARRGVIFDRDLHPLAMSLMVDSVFAVPGEITDLPGVARQLAGILDLDVNDLVGRLAASRNFCWVARKITPEQSRRLRALNLHGIYFQTESKRFYPKRDLAAQVLGYVGLDGNGLGGIEQEFDREVRGRSVRTLVQVDAHRHSYTHDEQAAEAGENLVLSIDQNIQYIAQQELEAAMQRTHAKHGTVIVEDPHNGEVLALANWPTFNPNDYRNASPAAMHDPAVSDPYEPGSTFKLITVSAALQEKLTQPDEMIDCQMGSIEVGGRRIHDHHAFGVMSVTDILKHSSDVGAIKLGLRLGDERFYRYIRAFGIGQPTGIELPGESRGLARPPQRWTKMSIGAISMGQEIAATPLQMAAVFATVADGGIYHAPHLIRGRFEGEAPVELPAGAAPAGRRVISGATANEMKMMLEQVVLAGTGQHAKLDGYTAAGKTGTAQRVDPGTHAYSKRNYIASFGGFAPLRDPAVVILAVVDSPQGLHEGGDAAAPIFKGIAQRVLPYLRVPQDIVTPPPARLQMVKAVDVRETSDPVSDLALNDAPRAVTPEVASAGPPAAGEAAVLPRGTVVLDYDGGATVPDFTGKSLRAVSELCETLGLNPSLLGNGMARWQQPRPGTHTTAGAHVVVQFSR